MDPARLMQLGERPRAVQGDSQRAANRSRRHGRRHRRHAPAAPTRTGRRPAADADLGPAAMRCRAAGTGFCLMPLGCIIAMTWTRHYRQSDGPARGAWKILVGPWRAVVTAATEMRRSAMTRWWGRR